MNYEGLRAKALEMPIEKRARLARELEATLRTEDIAVVAGRYCNERGIKESIVRGPSRLGVHVRARRDVVRFLHGHGFSYAAIGRWCKRDHTTILNLIESEGRQ